MKILYTKIIIIFFGLLNTHSHERVQTHKINLIYIGDSITAGAGLADPSNYPPAIVDNNLRKMGIDIAGSSNQGHGGYTTLDFLPNTDAFNSIEDAANKLNGNGGTLVFSIMLGTNDSAIKGPHGSPVTKEEYYENLRKIINQLIKDYPSSIIVIHRQLWYSPNTYNGAQYLQEGLNRLESYYPQIKKLINLYTETNTNKVYLGDINAFDYFRKNYQSSLQPEKGHEGTFYLHPNSAGAIELASFWSKAIYSAINNN